MIHDRGDRELERRNHDDPDPGFRAKAIRTISRAKPQRERRDEIHHQVGDHAGEASRHDPLLRAGPDGTGSGPGSGESPRLPGVVADVGRPHVERVGGASLERFPHSSRMRGVEPRETSVTDAAEEIGHGDIVGKDNVNDHIPTLRRNRDGMCPAAVYDDGNAAELRQNGWRRIFAFAHGHLRTVSTA